MKSTDSYEVFVDSSGKIRSSNLPSVAGRNLQLPDKLACDEGENEWNQKVNDPDELIVLDLFSGAGGFSYGFQNAGFFVAAGVDLDEASVWTHGYNFLSKSVCTDITAITDPQQFIKELGLPRVDVIIGGPPCQGFSQIGKAVIRSLGLEHHYHNILNNLYKEFVRFVEALNPQLFLMENVPAMAHFDNGSLIDRIKISFRNLNYDVNHIVLNAVEFGVPQKRKRLFIQGNNRGLPIEWPDVSDRLDRHVTLRDAIEDLPFCTPPLRHDVIPYQTKPRSKYQHLMRAGMHDLDVVYDHIIRDVRGDDKLIFAAMEEGHKYIDIPDELRRYRSDSFKDKYSKLIWDEPAWTVTAHISKDSYRYIHPDRNQGRMLSIREFARLQSFPDHFRFCGAPTRRMRQIGNAVPPLLAEAIARKLFNSLKGKPNNLKE